VHRQGQDERALRVRGLDRHHQRPRPRVVSSCCMPRHCPVIPMTVTPCVTSSRIPKSLRAARSSAAMSTRVTAGTTPRTRARVFISGQKRGIFGGIKRELRRCSAIELVIGHLRLKATSAAVSQRSCRRRRQRDPLRRRLQLPAYPRMAEGSLAPLHDRDPTPVDQPIATHSSFLTDD
jgi:hypothetical protein